MTGIVDQIYKMHVRSYLDYCDFIYQILEFFDNMNVVKDEDIYDDYEVDEEDDFEVADTNNRPFMTFWYNSDQDFAKN